MLPFLVWVPAATSLVLGIVYLFSGDGGPAFKIFGTVLFLAAVYLQFFSRYSLFGMIVQIGLALSLVLWRKTSATA